MKTSKVVIISALTTIVGALIVQKSGQRIPGFTR